MREISVCGAVIEKDGKVLISTRPEGQSLSGFWEFPGGKIEPGESDSDCLKREIMEELNAEIDVIDRIFDINYDYPDKRVELRFYSCVLKDEETELIPCDGQDIAWVDKKKLPDVDLLPADKPLADFLAGN